MVFKKIHRRKKSIRIERRNKMITLKRNAYGFIVTVIDKSFRFDTLHDAFTFIKYVRGI